jgi:hypothetical protein
VVAGSNRAPIAVTTLRRETLADMSRGRLRGWTIIGAIVFAVLAILSWPDPLGVLAFLGATVICAGAFVWIHVTLRDAEGEADDSRDGTTGEQD